VGIATRCDDVTTVVEDAVVADYPLDVVMVVGGAKIKIWKS
jgi:hypothetical protein